MGFCLFVTLSQSGAPVQATPGQILTTGRQHAAHRCTGFPFILHGRPGGMAKHHLRWDKNLNFYSVVKLHASAWIRISDMEGVPFSPACSGEGQTLPPQARLPAPCQLRAALSPLITTCLQCHHHLSLPCLQQRTPLPGFPVLPCLQPPQPTFHQTS